MKLFSFLLNKIIAFFKKELKQYNSGATLSIKNKIPFKLIYSEEFVLRSEAVKREKYFKLAAGRRFLKSKGNQRGVSEFPKSEA